MLSEVVDDNEQCESLSAGDANDLVSVWGFGAEPSKPRKAWRKLVDAAGLEVMQT